MTTAVMLDIETMGFRPETVVLTFGAIKFDPHSTEKEPGPGIYLRINVDEQLSMGRTVDDSTMEWWQQQDPAVMEEAFSDIDRVSVSDFYRELCKFLVGVDEVWAQGPTFDMIILENLFRQLGNPIPWKYSSVRDSRTLFKVVGDFRPETFEQAHNALVDCYVQAKAVQQAIKIAKKGLDLA